METILTPAGERYLRSLGYNPLRRFVENLAPLSVLDKTSEGCKIEYVGNSVDLFESSCGVPETTKDLIADFTVSENKDVSVKTTIRFLETFFKITNLQKAELEVSFKNAHSFTLGVTASSSDSVDSIKTARFLKQSSERGLNRGNYVTSRILDNISLQNPAYILVETLKATKISISARDSNNVSIRPNVEVLKNILELEVELGVEVISGYTVVLSFPTPKIYAIKVAPIWIRRNAIEMAPPVKINQPIGLIDYPTGFCFSEASSINNSDILTPVLLSPEGMFIDVKNA
jgi:hypothetical protein